MIDSDHDDLMRVCMNWKLKHVFALSYLSKLEATVALTRGEFMSVRLLRFPPSPLLEHVSRTCLNLDEYLFFYKKIFCEIQNEVGLREIIPT